MMLRSNKSPRRSCAVFQISLLHCCVYFAVSVLLGSGGTGQELTMRMTKSQKDGGNSSRSNLCQCMEYWSCASRNGQPYSYCGISETEVCCFIDYERESNNTLLEEAATKEVTKPGSKDSKVTIASPSNTTIKAEEKEQAEAAAVVCGRPEVPANLDSVSRFAEWPWHVAILEMTDDLYICGGSLISPNRVLTAAHCVNSYTRKSPRLKIRAGEYDVSTNAEPLPHIESIVTMVALHPEFNETSLENDIAILGLSRDIKFTENVRPVCLPQLDNPKPAPVSRIRRCVVTGWGRRSEDTPHSIILKEIIVPIWKIDDCERKLRGTFGPNFKLPPSSICAGDEKRDACDGDGGGPLVCYAEDGKWVQEGIVSFGIGCGRRESPGIYTKVSWFSSWIEAFLHSGVSNS